MRAVRLGVLRNKVIESLINVNWNGNKLIFFFALLLKMRLFIVPAWKKVNRTISPRSSTSIFVNIILENFYSITQEGGSIYNTMPSGLISIPPHFLRPWIHCKSSKEVVRRSISRCPTVAWRRTRQLNDDDSLTSCAQETHTSYSAFTVIYFPGCIPCRKAREDCHQGPPLPP